MRYFCKNNVRNKTKIWISFRKNTVFCFTANFKIGKEAQVKRLVKKYLKIVCKWKVRQDKQLFLTLFVDALIIIENICLLSLCKASLPHKTLKFLGKKDFNFRSKLLHIHKKSKIITMTYFKRIGQFQQHFFAPDICAPKQKYTMLVKLTNW